MNRVTPKRALRIPQKLVYTTFGCAVASAIASAVACAGSHVTSRPDAAADAAPDGCIYTLCNGPTMSPSCPGIVCLLPTDNCPSGCEPVV
jgi:hypothetical protein